MVRGTREPHGPVIGGHGQVIGCHGPVVGCYGPVIRGLEVMFGGGGGHVRVIAGHGSVIKDKYTVIHCFMIRRTVYKYISCVTPFTL